MMYIWLPSSLAIKLTLHTMVKCLRSTDNVDGGSNGVKIITKMFKMIILIEIRYKDGGNQNLI